jgi:hypothetical protein
MNLLDRDRMDRRVFDHDTLFAPDALFAPDVN